MKIIMTDERPKEEGTYFCKFTRNFEPVLCQVVRKGKKLWLNTKTTSQPVDKVKALCFSKKL